MKSKRYPMLHQIRLEDVSEVAATYNIVGNYMQTLSKEHKINVNLGISDKTSADTSVTSHGEDMDITFEDYVLSMSEDDDAAILVPIQHELQHGNSSPPATESEHRSVSLESLVNDHNNI